MTIAPDLSAANAHDEQNAEVAAAGAETQAAAVDDNLEANATTGGAEAGTVEDPPAGSAATTDGGEQPAEGVDPLKAYMEETGESREEILETVAAGKSLKGVLGDKDPKELLEKAEKYDTAQTERVAEERRLLEEEEEPEDTIARLKQEKQDILASQKETQLSAKELEANKKALVNYDVNVVGVVDGLADLPEPHKDLMKSILSSSGPELTVDIGNKIDTAKMVKQMAEKLQAFSGKVIEDYIAGKGVIPAITPTETAAVDAKGKEPQTFKEAARMLKERFSKKRPR